MSCLVHMEPMIVNVSNHKWILIPIIQYDSINNSQKSFFWIASALNQVQRVFTLIHTHSGEFTHVPAHSIAFRGCSILTQRRSCALNPIQGVFNTHSKVFMRTHILFRGCSIVFNTHSKAASPQRPNGYIGPIDLLSQLYWFAKRWVSKQDILCEQKPSR